MSRSFAGLILLLGVGAAGATPGASDLHHDPASIDAGEAPCTRVHNQGRDIIAEYLDARGDVVFRAGSWLGRDGRYLLPRPSSQVERIRFRALEDIAIDASDIALAPCADGLPEGAVDSLSKAIDHRLARYLGAASEDTDVIGHYETAIAALESTPHQHWLAVAHFEFASFLRASDRLDRAAVHYGAALSIFEALDDRAGRAASINSLGLVALRRGRPDEAARRFDTAKPLFLEFGDLHSVAVVDHNLGLLYLRRGQLAEAAAHLEMALTVLQGPLDLRAESPKADRAVPADSPAELTAALNTLNNLAIVRRQQGSVSLAERYWRNVLALEGHASGTRTGAEARHNLGGLLLREGRLDEALVLLADAVEQFDAERARRWMVEARILLSRLYFRLGDSESALEYALEAVDLQTQDLNALRRAHRHLADLQQEAGDYDAAVATVDRAMELLGDRPHDPRLLMLESRRAHLQLLLGEISEAVEAQRAVHESMAGLDSPVEGARVAYRLALALMAAGEAAEARALLEEAVTVFRQAREVFRELQALEALGRLDNVDAQARLEASTRAFRAGLKLRGQPLSDEHRIGLSSTLARIDQRHVRRLVEAGRHTEAWQAVARIRNTDMEALDRTHQRAREQSDRRALLAEHAERINELHARILREGDSDEHNDLRLAVDRVETRLRQLHDRPTARSKPSLRAVQQQLGDDRLLLSYYLLPGRTLLWEITSKEIRLHELPGRPDIEATVSELLRRLRHPRQAPGAIDRLASELGTALLAPASESIAAATEVVIEPHGVLHAVPFGLLIDGERLLLDRVAVSRVTSSGRPPTARPERRTRPERMLVLANPGWQSEPGQPPPLPRRSLVGQLMRDNALARLPGTQREAELLAALDAPEVALRSRTGRAASRQFVLGGGLAGYSVVHLATHGLVDLHYPNLSALLLADENGPGAALLRPQEIAQLQLDAGLVVLSGCETGAGAIPAGEGALSLARPFLVAGAARVVSTLWKIDDARTAEFMETFYRRLLEQGDTPARALAAAQRKMRQRPETAHPYYWAGFILTGNSLQASSQG